MTNKHLAEHYYYFKELPRKSLSIFEHPTTSDQAPKLTVLHQAYTILIPSSQFHETCCRSHAPGKRNGFITITMAMAHPNAYILMKKIIMASYVWNLRTKIDAETYHVDQVYWYHQLRGSL